MRYGDLGKRIVASIIDGIILFILNYLIFRLLDPYFGWSLLTVPYGWKVYMAVYGISNLIILPLIWLFIIFMYYTVCEGCSWHATIGKKMMGLYVAYSDGEGIKYSTAILRLIGKWLSGLFLGIGYIMGLFNDQKQCLHDMIAKTYVLEGNAYSAPREYAPGSRSATEYQPAAVAEGAHTVVGVSGPMAGTIYAVDEKGLLIGRDTISCQVVIPGTQEKVSRIHCFVTYNPMSGMFVLNDRNSTHGTFLANGKRVSYMQPEALRSGEKFYLATPDNMFEVR